MPSRAEKQLSLGIKDRFRLADQADTNSQPKVSSTCLDIRTKLTMLDLVTSVGVVSVLATGASAATIGSYNVDPSSVSVSGISSGGMFAVQLGVAYSNTFKTGFGIFAGGPYDCARNQSVGRQTPIDRETQNTDPECMSKVQPVYE